MPRTLTERISCERKYLVRTSEGYNVQYYRDAIQTYTRLDDASTDFTNIKRVVVTTASIRIRVNEGRIFPSLRKASIVEENVALLELGQEYRK
jgi:hypothetical protein